jgi:hypothetical protein
MRRRTLLSTVALAGAAPGIAGCLGENRTDRRPDPGTPGGGDGDGSNANEADDGPDRGPEATTEAFFEAFDSGDADLVNGFLHPDASKEPMTDEQAADLASDSVSASTTRLLDGSDESSSADVEALVRIAPAAEDDLAPRSYTVELRSEDGEWLVYSMRLTPPGESSIVPSAAFEFDHAEGTETIEHAGGDSIPAGRLYVRGDGLDATGSWAGLDGETSADVDGEPAVTTGDSLTVGVESSYSIRLVSANEEGTAAILSEMAGASESSSVTADDSGGSASSGSAGSTDGSDG